MDLSLCLPVLNALDIDVGSGNFVELREVFSKPDFPWEKTRHLKKAETAKLLDCLEEILESEKDTRSPLFTLLRLQAYLISRASNILPSNLSLERVEFMSSGSSSAGGCTIFHKGCYEGKLVALKTIQLLHEVSPSRQKELLRDVRREAVLWQNMHHPHILPLIGIYEEIPSEVLYLVHPYKVKESLRSYVKNNPYVNRYDLLYQLATAIGYLHFMEPPVLHGELNPANVFITGDRAVSITDFGFTSIPAFADVMNADSSHLEVARYTAPEILDFQPHDEDEPQYTRQSDIFALAMTIFEVLTNKVPLSEYSTRQVCGVIVTGVRPARSDVGKNEIWDLVERCWVQVSEDRPPIQDVIRVLRQAKFNFIPDASSSFEISPDLLIRVGTSTSELTHVKTDKQAVKVECLPDDVTCEELFEQFCQPPPQLRTLYEGRIFGGVRVIEIARDTRTAIIRFEKGAQASYAVQHLHEVFLRPKEHNPYSLRCHYVEGDAPAVMLSAGLSLLQYCANYALQSFKDFSPFS